MGRKLEKIKRIVLRQAWKRRPDVIQSYFNLCESAIYNAQYHLCLLYVVVILAIKITVALPIGSLEILANQHEQN